MQRGTKTEPWSVSLVGRRHVLRALRADALRNRELILDAAKRAFAEHGLGVRVDEIADIAGVGVATVYRRFRDKDALIAALFEQQVAEIVALADEALTSFDDGAGLRSFFERTIDAMSTDRGLQQILTGPHAGAEQLSGLARREVEPRVTELLRRAQHHGRVRADLVTGDLPIIQVILGAIIDATPGAARPVAALHRAPAGGAAAAAGREPDAGPAPTPAEGVLVVETWRPSVRRAGARG